MVRIWAKPTPQELAGELPRKSPKPKASKPRIGHGLEEVGHWIGRVVQLQNFTVLVYLGNGTLAELPRDFNGGILDDFYWDER